MIIFFSLSPAFSGGRIIRHFDKDYNVTGYTKIEDGRETHYDKDWNRTGYSVYEDGCRIEHFDRRWNRQGHSETEEDQDMKIQGMNLEHLGPEDVLLLFLNAKSSKDSYALLSEKDKEAVSLQEYLSYSKTGFYSDISYKIPIAIMKKTSYKIKNITLKGSVAEARVEFFAPRIPFILLGRSILKLEDFNEESENLILSYLNSDNVIMDKRESLYNILKENLGWRVFLDFKERKRIYALKKRIAALVAEAEALAPSSEMLGSIAGATLESMKPNLLAAEKKYKEALSIGNDDTATRNLQYLTKQLDKLKFYEKHKGNIIIKNVQVGESKYDGIGVFGEIKNKSDVTLTSVGIIIYFLDQDGNPIHEKSYHPVFVTDSGYGDYATPLKPNYSRKFGVKADDAPSEWSQKVKIVLLDLEGE